MSIEEELKCSCGHCHNHKEEHNHTHSHNHEHNHKHEEDKKTILKKIIISFILFIIGLIIQNINTKIDYQLKQYIFGFFYLVAFLLCGKNVVINAIKNIKTKDFFDEQLLMTLASFGAIYLKEFPEAVAIMLFYQIGEFFQDYAVDKSKNSITSLIKQRPQTANVLNENKIQKVNIENVQIGQIILVKPGEIIPIDGIVTKGESFTNNSSLTGENVPVRVNINSQVFSGTINTTGVLEIKTTKLSKDSAAEKIIQLIQEASTKKTKSELFIKKFAKIYTPIVVILALLIILIPGFITNEWNTWLYRGLTFLVVSCPCALVISIPLSYFAGIGYASKKGILIKGSINIDNLSKIKTIAFDKTGTLTKGIFEVQDVHSKSLTKEQLLTIAAHAEKYSNHPISKSLQNAHNKECCNNLNLKDFTELSGKGIKVILNNKEILAGNSKLMDEFNIKNYENCKQKDYGTIIHIAIDNEYAGHILINDKIKEQSQNTVKELKKLGINKIAILSGDDKTAVEEIAKELEIKEVYSNLLPKDKVSKIEELISSTNGKVAFTGDGINDAPVLKRADVGIAMGALGSDAAIQASDIVIMKDELNKIPLSIKISKKTLRTVYQNIVFSISVKVLIIILASFGIANMWTAVFGDVGVSFIAIINSTKILFNRKE